ncbi:MAG TPA: hypothetical protein VLS27_08730 [Gammaproteobacteria bacterium]|nr:hypothetical protein [Gammaproteobacteria bacterium]
MGNAIENGGTPVIFLAMFWGGGGPYTISKIIGVYDWINRAIPGREEMESGLNTLLAMGLVERRQDEFFIPEPEYRAFDVFRKKKRKNKFETVRMYFGQLPEVAGPAAAIRLSEDEYNAYVEENSRAFAQALRYSKQEKPRR